MLEQRVPRETPPGYWETVTAGRTGRETCRLRRLVGNWLHWGLGERASGEQREAGPRPSGEVGPPGVQWGAAGETEGFEVGAEGEGVEVVAGERSEGTWGSAGVEDIDPSDCMEDPSFVSCSQTCKARR